MKSFYCLIIAIGGFIVTQAQSRPGFTPGGSMQGPPVGPRNLSAYSTIVNINGADGYYYQQEGYLEDKFVVLNGERVLGTPFLFFEWSSGILLTQDGRTYTNYPLRFDVYNQTVSFLNGKDSLDVTDEIKEFTLVRNIDGKSMALKFVNAGQFGGKYKKLGYLDLLLEGKEGTLLKSIKKAVVFSDNGILAGTSKRFLDFKTAYYYYNKTSKKLNKLEFSENVIRQAVGMDEAVAKAYDAQLANLDSEAKLIDFFKKYLSQ